MASLRPSRLQKIIKKRIRRVKNDPLRIKQLKLSELDIDVIATVLGFNTNDILQEEENLHGILAAHADSNLHELEEQQDKFMDEQRQIYRGNRNVQRRVLRQYIPIIRERYGAPPMSPREAEKLARTYEDV